VTVVAASAVQEVVSVVAVEAADSAAVVEVSAAVVTAVLAATTPTPSHRQFNAGSMNLVNDRHACKIRWNPLGRCSRQNPG